MALVLKIWFLIASSISIISFYKSLLLEDIHACLSIRYLLLVDCFLIGILPPFFKNVGKGSARRFFLNSKWIMTHYQC